MNSHQMRQILDHALRERAPSAYQEMQHQDELATYLDNLTAEAMQSISTATTQAIPRLTQIDDPMKRVQHMEMARKTAEEVALSQAMEELPLEPVEDENDPPEPMTLEEMTRDESLLSINRHR